MAFAHLRLFLLTCTTLVSVVATAGDDVQGPVTQGAAAPATARITVVSISMQAGQPIQVNLSNGSVISFKNKEGFAPLKSTLTLSENSCTQELGTKVDFIVPIIWQSLIPYWLKHPSKQGTAVIRHDSSDKKDRVYSNTAFISRVTNTDEFSSHLAQLPTNQIVETDIYQETLKEVTAMGWLECQSDCGQLLPTSKSVIFWDENFETPNNQVSMVRYRNVPSLNQMTSRLEDVNLTLSREGKTQRIFFSRPKNAFGLASFFLPPGITYQVQWTFQAPNLVDVDDPLCQMKWDMDFTRVFTQFTSASETVIDPKLVNIKDLPDYIFDPKDKDRVLFSDMFQTYRWESSEVQK